MLALLAACSGDKERPPVPAPAGDKERPPSRETLPKIVAFGDSLTAGYGLADPRESYPALLQEKLDADGYRYEVVNAGVSGDTSAGGAGRIDWSLRGDVRFLILELGANDHLRGQPVRETKKNLTEIIRRAQARGAVVLLAGMLSPPNMGAQYQREVFEMYREVAREQGVTLIPFFLEGVAGVETLNQADSVHPNPEGTRIVADMVYRALKPLLDEQAGRQQR